MWTGTIITVLFISIGAIADAKSITISNARLVSTRGGSCRQENGIYRCSVIRGETATFQGVLNVDGGDSHAGIELFQVTLEFTREQFGEVASDKKTCQTVGGDVVIGGDCDVTSIAEGSYNIVPFSVKVPDVDSSITTNFRALGKASWSDGTTTQEIEIGRCRIDIE
ncbi:uncharacterized protein LOC124353493 [Homalodisca vitripennis]|uniref:uncharacterized protein LOC124353493 n=1 Tax=Homalodisca vitripennis TaxID=197043 RepID=UPI001EEB4382|nr:uncharacterized protein LOC124353493 [Homalodisca vitripennis]